MEYKYYPNRPEKLTSEFVHQEFAKLTSRIPAAEASDSSKEWLDLYRDWNALNAYYSGEGSRIHYAHAKDMKNDAITEADKYFREQVTPAMDKGNAVMLDAFLKSRYKDAIGDHYGPYLIEALMTSVEPLAPINSKLESASRRSGRSIPKACKLRRSYDPRQDHYAFPRAWIAKR